MPYLDILFINQHFLLLLLLLSWECVGSTLHQHPPPIFILFYKNINIIIIIIEREYLTSAYISPFKKTKVK